MLNHYIDQTKFNTILSKTNHLQRFFQDTKCPSCCMGQPMNLLCSCLGYANAIKEIALSCSKEDLLEKPGQHSKITSVVFEMFLPMSFDSMVERMNESDAKSLEEGEAAVTIEPLVELTKPSFKYLGVKVNSNLVYVSPTFTYSNCASILESYMNSH